MASIVANPPVQVCLQARDAGPGKGLLGIFAGLQKAACPWLLDSALPDPRLGRYSFAGADPWAILRARGCELELHVRRPAHPRWRVGTHRRVGDPFEWLRDLLPAAGDLFPSADGSGRSSQVPFVGGAVGYFGYELATHIESVRLPASEGTTFPDLALLLVDSVVAFDHQEKRLHHFGLGFARTEDEAAAQAKARLDDLARRRFREPARKPARRRGGRTPVRQRFQAEAYGGLVREVKSAIRDGDLYQACLTHRLEVDYDGDPWPLYRRLREGNPAPFAAYLSLPEGTLLSSSPERFLRLSAEGEVEARPIKGTADIGARDGRPSEAEVEASRRALATSAKDRAENVMIVDLYRNDLGRVCEIGSISVPELCSIERYGRLHQMVSTVTGRLAEGQGAVDLIRASFPPGSMTGAPKIAAMQLLAELEPVRRGAYAGALGYLDLRGGMDLSVVIRTLLVSEGRAHLHVGGGIVADSQPEAEYQESMDKARALLEALGASIPTSPLEGAVPSLGVHPSEAEVEPEGAPKP